MSVTPFEQNHTLDIDRVRGGETGHHVRYVLGASLFLAWAALSALVLFVMI